MKENSNETRKVIKVQTNSPEEERRVLTKFHNKLHGEEDYIESNIILNDFETRKLVNPDEDTENEVHLYVHDDSSIDVDVDLQIIHNNNEEIASNEKGHIVIITEASTAFKCIDNLTHNYKGFEKNTISLIVFNSGASISVSEIKTKFPTIFDDIVDTNNRLNTIDIFYTWPGDPTTYKRPVIFEVLLKVLSIIDNDPNSTIVLNTSIRDDTFSVFIRDIFYHYKNTDHNIVKFMGGETYNSFITFVENIFEDGGNEKGE